MWIGDRPRCRSLWVVRITVEIESGSVTEIPAVVGLVFRVPYLHPDTRIGVAGGALFPHQYPIEPWKSHLIGCLGCPTLFLLVRPEVLVTAPLLSAARLPAPARQAR